MPGPDLSHREAAGVGVGMERASEVRDAKTAIFRVAILGLGVWSLVAFVRDGDQSLSAEAATRKIAGICEEIDVGDASRLDSLSLRDMNLQPPQIVIAEIDNGMDELGRLTEIIETAADSDLAWSSSAKSQRPVYEFLGDMFRTVRNGLSRGQDLSDLSDEIRRLGEPTPIEVASFDRVHDGMSRIDECQRVMKFFSSSGS
jgi:hypothetical protein